MNRNQLRIITGSLRGHCHLKGHLFKPGLLGSPACYKFKQASEMASRVVGDCEALATLRFKNLGLHIMKPGDCEDVFFSRILHFAQNAGLHEKSITVKVHKSP